MKKVVVASGMILLSVLVQAQVSDDVYKYEGANGDKKELSLLANNQFSYFAWSSQCDCGYSSKGYFLTVKDSLILIHKPQQYDYLSKYRLTPLGTRAHEDSIKVNFVIRDKLDSLLLPKVRVTIIEKVQSEPHIINSERILSSYFTDSEGKVELMFNSQLRGRLLVTYFGYNSLNIDLEELISDSKVEVEFSAWHGALHTTYNEDFFIEKFLIRMNSTPAEIRSIDNDTVILTKVN